MNQEWVWTLKTMILPPGGFLTLGVLLTFFAWIKERRARRPERGVA